jgi:hypothetical protein
MTDLGALALAVVALLLVFWILELIRKGRLYVGYGIAFLGIALLTLLVVSVPGAASSLGGLTARFFPAAPLGVVGFVFVVAMLVYVLHQLTVISNRVARLTRELAIRGVEASSPAREPGIDREPEQSDGEPSPRVHHA